MKKIINLSILLILSVLLSCSSERDKSPDSEMTAPEKSVYYSDEPSENEDNFSTEKSKKESKISPGSDELKDQSGLNNDPKANEELITSSAAKVSSDSTHKFIKTANLRFRVKDVRKSTRGIEDIAFQFKGFVTYTHLTSSIYSKEITPVSADSSLETIYYTVENTLTIRVPNAKLDSTLRAMAAHIDYLDHRTIVAEDVRFSLMSDALKQKRMNESSERLIKAIENRGKKLRETTQAEESLLNKQTQHDEAIISLMKIHDKIDYSTINLYIYQRQEVKRSLIENYKNIDEYKPNFFLQLWESILVGWGVLLQIILGLISIWPIYILGAAAWIVYKKYIKKKNEK